MECYKCRYWQLFGEYSKSGQGGCFREPKVVDRRADNPACILFVISKKEFDAEQGNRLVELAKLGQLTQNE